MGECRMDVVVLGNVSFALDTGDILDKLRLKSDSAYCEDVTKMVAEAVAIARPKAIYGLAPVKIRGESDVAIGGIDFASRVLRVNLDQVDKVVPYVITVGRELEKWSLQYKDMLYSYYADFIKGSVLTSARETAMSAIDRQYDLKHTARMNPGSLEDWPLTQQVPLFQLLGDVKGAIGVELTESCLMFPVKTVSGIYYETADDFASCQLCPKENCPNRRAKYDEHLYEQKYQAK